MWVIKKAFKSEKLHNSSRVKSSNFIDEGQIAKRKAGNSDKMFSLQSLAVQILFIIAELTPDTDNPWKSVLQISPSLRYWTSCRLNLRSLRMRRHAEVGRFYFDRFAEYFGHGEVVWWEVLYGLKEENSPIETFLVYNIKQIQTKQMEKYIFGSSSSKKISKN